MDALLSGPCLSHGPDLECVYALACVCRCVAVGASAHLSWPCRSGEETAGKRDAVRAGLGALPFVLSPSPFEDRAALFCQYSVALLVVSGLVSSLEFTGVRDQQLNLSLGTEREPNAGL